MFGNRFRRHYSLGVIMDIVKIENALDQLVSKNFIQKKGIIYSFTDEGRKFSKAKSSDSWCDITWFLRTCSEPELWVPYSRYQRSDYRWGWGFIKYSNVTEEQFEKFCEYFEIENSFDDGLLDLDDIIM